jgi:hypothetical protein
MESGAVRHNLKWDYPRTIPAKSGLIWFSSFRGEVLNVIFYQNMPNLHNHPNTFIQGQYVFYYTEMPNDSGVHYVIRRAIVNKVKSHKL